MNVPIDTGTGSTSIDACACADLTVRPPIAPQPKDLAASALVLGISAAAWCAWGSSGALALRPWFLVGIGAGLLLAVTALLLRRGMSGEGSHRGPDRAAVQRTYNRALIGEVILIVAGNAVLGLTGHPEYIICWTYAVMSVHFLPLARVYRIPLLRLTAHVGVLIAVAAAALGTMTTLSPIALTGGVGAPALLVSGALQLQQARKVDGDHR